MTYHTFHGCPGLGQHRAGLFYIKFNAHQKGPVQHPPDLRGGLLVDRRAQAHQGDGLTEGLGDVFVLGFGLGKSPLGGQLLPADAVLLRLQEVEWDGVGIGHLDKLAPLVIQDLHLAGSPLPGLRAVRAPKVQLVLEGDLCRFGVNLVHPHP
ncbi:hypothetical protein E0F15_06695 [Frankia sp. B2]|uniref:hypothetical protein n=1 Tax=unclassified Frankia TaxID=2632575 RepID=UPI0010554A09|nr:MULTISPECIES: hypothetical protein [unclassified Frankia]TFE33157.1 hypothetical protein E0F15_06695 [Frankia sp. B2]